MVFFVAMKRSSLLKKEVNLLQINYLALALLFICHKLLLERFIWMNKNNYNLVNEQFFFLSNGSWIWT